MSDVVAAKVRELRKARRWQLAELAERCAELDGRKWTENTIENIEGGRRRAGSTGRRAVTVDEMDTLARALGVNPVNLLPDQGAALLGPLSEDELRNVISGLQAFLSLQDHIRATEPGGGA